MRTVSQTYRDLRNQEDSYYDVKVVRENTTYGMGVLKSLYITEALFDNSGPQIGRLCSKRCELTLMESSENWPRMASFEVFLRISSADGETKSEWLSFGEYYTDERSEDGYGDLTIVAFDGALMLETSWVDKISGSTPWPDGTWPVTSKQWLDMCEAANIFEVDSRTVADNTVRFIGLDETTTARQVLYSIASAHGSNWQVTPEGKIRLVPFANLPDNLSGAVAGIAIAGIAVVGTQGSENSGEEVGSGVTGLWTEIRDIAFGPALEGISGVELTNMDGTTIAAGDSSGYVIQGECEFSTTTGVAEIALDRIEDYSYRPFSSSIAYLDPAAELGDLLILNGQYYQLMTITWDITKHPAAEMSAPFDAEVDHEYTYESETKRYYKRTLKKTQALDERLVSAETSIIQNENSITLMAKATRLGIQEESDNEIEYPFLTGDTTVVEEDGITYTYNGDGSITIAGTSTAAINKKLTDVPTEILRADGSHIFAAEMPIDFSPTIPSGYASPFYVKIFDSSESSSNDYYLSDTQNDGDRKYRYKSVTPEFLTTTGNVYFYFRLSSSQTVDVTIYPQILIGSELETWTPPVGAYTSERLEHMESNIKQTGDKITSEVKKIYEGGNVEHSSNLVPFPLQSISSTTGYSVKSNDDGSYTIEKTDNNGAWYLEGSLSLPAGTYSIKVIENKSGATHADSISVKFRYSSSSETGWTVLSKTTDGDKYIYTGTVAINASIAVVFRKQATNSSTPEAGFTEVTRFIIKNSGASMEWEPPVGAKMMSFDNVYSRIIQTESEISSTVMGGIDGVTKEKITNSPNICPHPLSDQNSTSVFGCEDLKDGTYMVIKNASANSEVFAFGCNRYSQTVETDLPSGTYYFQLWIDAGTGKAPPDSITLYYKVGNSFSSVLMTHSAPATGSTVHYYNVSCTVSGEITAFYFSGVFEEGYNEWVVKPSIATSSQSSFHTPNMTVEYSFSEVYSTIRQTADTVSMKVSKNGIISQINMTNETVKIQASKIDLQGYLTVSDVGSQGTTEIYGNRIKGGTITLGGLNNGNGSLNILDSSGTSVVSADNAGIVINRANIRLGGNDLLRGNLSVMDSTDTDEIISIGKTGIVCCGNKSGTLSTAFKIQRWSWYINEGETERNYFREDVVKLSGSGSYIERGWLYAGLAIGMVTLDTTTWPGGYQYIKAYKNSNLLYTIKQAGIDGIHKIKLRGENGLSETSDTSTIEIVSESTCPRISGRNSSSASFGSVAFYNAMIQLDGEVNVTGDFNVISGYQKNRVVKTKSFGERKLTSYETPTPMFGDVGDGIIDADGLCYVFIDSVFAETISGKAAYYVFLQKLGAGDCYVEERKKAYFVVRGTPGMSFSWEIKAKQREYDQVRLEIYDKSFADVRSALHGQYDSRAADYIKNFYEN